jgi:glutamyl-Q tRNA(Asp) synthetase
MFTTRFAPSPTGRLHLGHAFSALTASGWARAHGARFVLRIEDIDAGRCRPEFEAGIREDLSWLGLGWDAEVRRQSDHLDEYARALERLRAMGVVYRCFLTRREIAERSLSAPHDERAIYTGPAHRMSADEEGHRLALGEPYAWRLSIRYSQDLLGEEFARLDFREEDAGPSGEHGVVRAQPGRLGDVVLARKDAPASYHLCVTHDDALQGVSHVIRGRDLFASTHVHVLLQRLMGWPTPVYRHHRLLLDAAGRRFAKRDRAPTLAALREAGETPADVRARLGLAG